MQQECLSIVMPAYNEQATLATGCKEL